MQLVLLSRNLNNGLIYKPQQLAFRPGSSQSFRPAVGQLKPIQRPIFLATAGVWHVFTTTLSYVCLLRESRTPSHSMSMYSITRNTFVPFYDILFLFSEIAEKCSHNIALKHDDRLGKEGNWGPSHPNSTAHILDKKAALYSVHQSYFKTPISPALTQNPALKRDGTVLPIYKLPQPDLQCSA